MRARRFSTAKLAREHGLNANLVFTWRHRYRAEQRASEATLLPVTVVSDMRTDVIAASTIKPEIVKPAVPVGMVEVRIGRAIVKVDGVIDPDMQNRTGEPAIMASLPTGTRIWLMAGVTDMRFGFQGLANQEVQTALEKIRWVVICSSFAGAAAISSKFWVN